jgi:hypothetical protein
MQQSGRALMVLRAFASGRHGERRPTPGCDPVTPATLATVTPRNTAACPRAQTRATKQSGCHVWIAAGPLAPSRRRLRRALAVARVSGAEPVDGSSKRATKLVAGHHLRSRRAMARSTRAPKRATARSTPRAEARDRPANAARDSDPAGRPGRPHGTRCLLDFGVWRARDLAEQGRRGPCALVRLPRSNALETPARGEDGC